MGECKDPDVISKPSDQLMVYDCMIMLKGRKRGTPIIGADFNIGANMPSMSGAFNAKLIVVKLDGMPGMYSGLST